MNFEKEQEVAKEATRRLEAAVRSKTSWFKAHVNQSPGTAIREATSKAKLRFYKNEANKRVGRINKITLQMGKHGFVQHYGVNDTLRSDAVKKSRWGGTYNSPSGQFNLRSKPFITQAINGSSVVDFVMENVSRIRGQEMMDSIKTFLENPRQ